MRRAVVVGAGIGGVAAAGALAQAGWQVTVLERAPELGEVGAGISIWPPALRVLDGLGIGDKLRGEGSLSGSAGVRRPDGRSTRLDSNCPRWCTEPSCTRQS